MSSSSPVLKLAELGPASPPLEALAVVGGLAVLLVYGAVAWRLRSSASVTLEGRLRAGSLRCDDECHFELTLETRGGTRVRVDRCIMPDTLRDWPGQSLDVLAAGHWESERVLRATFLATRQGRADGRKPSSGRPPACFVPPARGGASRD